MSKQVLAAKKKKETVKVKRLTLPIPESTCNAIDVIAKKQNRSMTKQIVFILENYVIQEEKEEKK